MAFMNVLSDRRSMLKNGSRMGYRSLPHRAVCSKMCAMPVSSVGVVRNATLKTLLGSSAPQCIHRAPVLRCTSSTHATLYSGTSFTVSTSKAPSASLAPGLSAAMAATAGAIAVSGAGAASTARACWFPRLPICAVVTPAMPPMRMGRRPMPLPRFADASARTVLPRWNRGVMREASVDAAAQTSVLEAIIVSCAASCGVHRR
mmetsp:Transcript_3565/g.16291  ORF Transcript_3565/g.16291 Transcript_3565/m.16291 type:complete len:203 (-) Transcript_3565:32-640(-)